MTQVLYDTWAFLALGCSSDPAHAAAGEAHDWLEANGYEACTTDYVIDEAITGIHGLLGARACAAFLDDLALQLESGLLMRVSITDNRWRAAERWFRRLAPETPRLSFTDCTSFAVMEELGVRWALTGDRHFLRAGRKIQPLFVRDGERLVFRRPVR